MTRLHSIIWGSFRFNRVADGGAFGKSWVGMDTWVERYEEKCLSSICFNSPVSIYLSSFSYFCKLFSSFLSNTQRFISNRKRPSQPTS
ncbi:hypothetical protein EYC84_004004 [Monilinia fructicola]|uniref:Uncharacterized protein n=1 Tax=Monilinia fructicola TaxID=38448 RepID=A0A5M9JYX2_MONFR|nr:hypothetical protein EYC84_004004 [Monilinia fructicola]